MNYVYILYIESEGRNLCVCSTFEVAEAKKNERIQSISKQFGEQQAEVEKEDLFIEAVPFHGDN